MNQFWIKSCRNYSVLLFIVLLFTQNGIAFQIPILKLNSEMHISGISGISIDKKGLFVLTGSNDKTAKLWNAQTGELIRTFRIPINTGQEGLIYASAISPDGKKVLLAGVTGYSWYGEMSVYVYNAENGEMLKRIGGLKDIVLDLEFNEDGSLFAAATSRSAGVHIYNADSYELVKSLIDNTDSCYNVEFDKNNRLATVSYDGFVRIYDNQFALITQKQTISGNHSYSLSFSPDGSLLAVGYDDSSQIDVLDGQTLQLLYKPDVTNANTDQDRLFIVSFSEDGKYLYAGGLYQKLVDNSWQQVIRKWGNSGNGEYIDIPVGSNTILDIKKISTGGILFGGTEPEFGKIGVNDSLELYKSGEINNFRSADNTHFRVNFLGDVVGFTPIKGLPVTFSIAEKRLEIAELEVPFFLEEFGGVSVKNWDSSRDVIINNTPVFFLEEYERTFSVDIFNENNIVFGADWNVYAVNKNGAIKWKTPIQSPAFAIKISGNGKVAVAAHGDGTIRWYRMDDGLNFLSVFTHPDNQRWISWSPAGYYDSSPNASELIGWSMNNGLNSAASFYPIDRFFERFFRPDLFARLVVDPYAEQKIIAEQSITEFKKPPLVEIDKSRNYDKIETEEVIISTKITDMGGGISEIRLFHNGKLVSADTRALKNVSKGNQSKVITKDYSVRLLPGDNDFRLTAFNSDRIESNPSNLKIKYSGIVASSVLYVISVGINLYKNSLLNLNYGKPDAMAFVETIKNQSSKIFKSIQVHEIYDYNATKETLMEAFNDVISKAEPKDTFMFFYAGHGVMSEASEDKKEDFYIALHNVVKIYGDNKELENNGISASDLTGFTTEIKATKQMIILDACHSGGAIKTFASRGASEQKAILQMARSAGFAVMASTGTEQYATEFKALGHGVFTYALLNGLKGEADGGIKDGNVTVKELDAYINSKVPELTQIHKGQSQYPNSFSSGQDFPISLGDEN